MRDYDLNPILESSTHGVCVCSELLRQNRENIDQKPLQRSEQKNISLSQSVHSEV